MAKQLLLPKRPITQVLSKVFNPINQVQLFGVLSKCKNTNNLAGGNNRKNCFGERGSITVWQALALTAFLSLTVMIFGYAQVASQRNRVQAVADLASISAAQHAFYYPNQGVTGCQRARQVATANQADLVYCRQTLTRIQVSVAFPASALGRIWQIKASSTAGPANLK